jgi:UDP-N-acetylglucosamine pyrophosphorylase
VLIVSVRAGLDPYGFISRYQAVNGSDKPAGVVADEIYKILVQHSKTNAAMAEAIVALFEQADSFAEAKRRVALLSDVQSWTPELLRRIEEAVHTNSQIESSWGVPGRVEAILKQNGGAGFSLRASPPPPDPFEIQEDELSF